MLLSNVQQAHTLKDLLKIFYKYVVPTELALGSHKLCQLVSTKNSDAVHIYAQTDGTQNRMKSILFCSKSW